jgi:hypothetical protein
MSLLDANEPGCDKVVWAPAGVCQCGPITKTAAPPTNAHTPKRRIDCKRFMGVHLKEGRDDVSWPALTDMRFPIQPSQDQF